MVDVKRVDEKGIPPPVTIHVQPSARKQRVLKLIGLAALFITVQLWFFDGRNRFVSLFAHEKGHHHHRHGKVPAGKHAEKLFLSIPDEKSSKEASRHYSSQPHPAGSDFDLQTAKDFLHFVQRELGIPAPGADPDPIFPAGSPESQAATRGISKAVHPYAWIDTYYPVMNTPLDRALQIVADNGSIIWDADLEERADDTDPLAGKYSEAVPAFHGLSAQGNVTGNLIYANYGLREDYDDLVAKGVNFTGAIVIARYGGNFRGLKIKAAQELGAAGVLIYSDTRDDGNITVENGYEPYPDGPARNPKSVQRGSVQFISSYPGDPTTPGYPSYENASRTDGENIPKIPSLPISWANARVLLDKLDAGKNVTVRLVNNVNTRVMPIWNTMAVVPGPIKDEVIVVGNHRDAWVMGAVDPTSGTASMHETIRGFGALLRKGWRPLRTVVFASWDAEEYGLIGSTEWGEDFADWIIENVVSYLNLDSSVSGSRYSAQASPLLAHVVRQTASEIPHPTKKGKTLWDAIHDNGTLSGLGGPLKAEDEEVKSNVAVADELNVGVLGSGSDYTVFLERLGVASMQHGFGGTGSDPVYHYHSVYDSERWMELYGDPGFHRHIAVAKHQGLLTLRIADSIVLPLNTTHYSYELEDYLDTVAALASQASFDLDLEPLRHSIYTLQAASRGLDYEKLVAERELVELIKQWKKKKEKLDRMKRKLRKAICKIKKIFGGKCHKPHHHPHHPPHDPPYPYRPETGTGVKTRFGRLPGMVRERNFEEDKSVLRSMSLHSGYDLRGFGCGHHPLPSDFWKAVKRVRAVNKKLIDFERGFISPEGIPDREWYRHLGVSPGKWLGYGATTLPALTEAITLENNQTLAEHEASRLKAVVDGLTATVRV